MEASFTVSSYNVLAFEAANSDFLTTDDPGDLAFWTRMPKILETIFRMADAEHIICLQEVDSQIAHVLFLQMQRFYPNYELLASNDPKFQVGDDDVKSQERLPVWILFPKQKYALADSPVSECLAELIPREPPKDAQKLAVPLPEHAWALHGRSAWNQARRYPNRLLRARLVCRSTKRDFVVMVFHMPCCFKFPAVMTLFANELRTTIAKAQREHLEVILAADMNLSSTTPAYHAFLTGALLPDSPEVRPHLEWQMDDAKLRLFNARGLRPLTPTTRVRLARENNKIFAKDLDHIFHTRGINVATFHQPIIADDEILPNTTHGSDHVAITCSVQLV